MEDCLSAAERGEAPTLQDLAEMIGTQMEWIKQGREEMAEMREGQGRFLMDLHSKVALLEEEVHDVKLEIRNEVKVGVRDVHEEMVLVARSMSEQVKTQVYQEIDEMKKEVRTMRDKMTGAVQVLEEKFRQVSTQEPLDKCERTHKEEPALFPSCHEFMSQPCPKVLQTPSIPNLTMLTPPNSPSWGCKQKTRRKPQDFDGLISLEAYLAQFEVIAEAQAWDDHEKAVQLVSSLKGQAVEVLSHLTMLQRTSYESVKTALERRYGHQYQEEAFRARFRARIRTRGETLQHLAQDLEALVHRAYPGANENLIVVLLRDQFVDALQDYQLQVYVKQAHTTNLQQALARALEYESFRISSGTRLADHQDVYARRSGIKEQRGGTSTSSFTGECWACGQKGHRRNECSKKQQSGPQWKSTQYKYQPCCWNCGQSGHLSKTCPQQGKGMGNDRGLGEGVYPQPETLGPQSD